MALSTEYCIPTLSTDHNGTLCASITTMTASVPQVTAGRLQAAYTQGTDACAACYRARLWCNTACRIRRGLPVDCVENRDWAPLSPCASSLYLLEDKARSANSGTWKGSHSLKATHVLRDVKV